MFAIPYFWVGFVVIVFIISVVLMIFAPKSINFYPDNVYPIIEYIHNNNIDIIKSDLNDIKEISHKNKSTWMQWPDNKFIKGNYQIYPIYMFSVLNESRKKKCVKTYNLIKNIPNIKTCTFIKIDSNSLLKKNKKWKELSNHTLCCFFILEAPMASINDCGIWINGESKKISKNKLLIFDSSKKHSIYNNTDYPVYGLMLDINRPKDIPNGSSNTIYNNEVVNFIDTLSN
jgi:aspartyl/asparaginyl beta-hydroxylase (cupin superfamily)